MSEMRVRWIGRSRVAKDMVKDYARPFVGGELLFKQLFLLQLNLG